LARSRQAPAARRRLSIIDPAPRGRQPFVSRDGRLWLVFNGAIYNYLELRETLRELGHGFATETDTEVLLAAFAQWGTGCFQRLNGMWAALFWDRQRRTLTACRDRLGIKPLFYARSGQRWLFASEAKPLLRHAGVSSRPNLRALADYLAGWVEPAADQTFFEAVRSVTPGTWLQLRDDRLSHGRYWNLPAGDGERITDLDLASAQLGTLLGDSVRLRMRADVRVGTMLSGGIDSTSIIAEMNRLRRGDVQARRATGPSLHAFHASFPGLPIDESGRVEAMLHGADVSLHSRLPAGRDDVEALYQHSLEHMERPFYRGVPLVHTILMRAATKHGVKVVLNGHGADELFAGYPSRHLGTAALDDLLQLRPLAALAKVEGMLRAGGLLALRQLPRVVTAALPAWLTPRAAHKRWGAIAEDLLLPTTSTGAAGGPWQMDGASLLDRTLRWEVRRRVLPAWLEMEDRVSMAASIEARTPFLDHRLVELAFSLADGLKVGGGITKRVLRHAVRPGLPAEIVDQRRKYYYSGPDAVWLRGPLRPLLSRMLQEGEPRVAALVDVNKLRGAIDAFLAGDSRRTMTLWTMLNAEAWLRHFCDGYS